MNPPAPFHGNGPSHWGALIVIFGAAALVIRQARRTPRGSTTLVYERLLAAVLLLFPFGKLGVQVITGAFDRQSALPLHYCDLAAMAGAAALLTRRQWLCEITYFFGLAGTLQALITPALREDLPDPRFFIFFGGHGAVVIAALYVVLGMRRAPLPGAVGRMMIATTLYAAIVGGLNVLLGTNYGFLADKPPTASVMDHLGPWPWYLGSLWLLALLLYSALYLPFWVRRRREARATWD